MPFVVYAKVLVYAFNKNDANMLQQRLTTRERQRNYLFNTSEIVRELFSPFENFLSIEQSLVFNGQKILQDFLFTSFDG